MWTKGFYCCILMFCSVHNVFAQSVWAEWNENVSTEEELLAWQDMYEGLEDIATHPFDLNTVTKEQLEQLPFLSDWMIENILYFIYKYGPLVSFNELLGVEGIDRQTLHYLRDFVYVKSVEQKPSRLSWKNIWKYNQQELSTRVDIPLNQKAGYASYSAETLEKSPNKKYLGDPVYHNMRYRFRYGKRLAVGVIAEKDAGEPFFQLHNRAGYDFYSAYLFLQDVGWMKKLMLGNYRANFGHGLVINMNFRMGKSYSLSGLMRMGSGLSAHSSMGEDNYLQGMGATVRMGTRWQATGFYSFRQRDALCEGGLIRSLKTDGYHRLPKDMEKVNTVSNHLAGMNIAYNGKYVEYGLTAVYTAFNKMLIPIPRIYNRYDPQGRVFTNMGVHYKFFLKHCILSGESAVDWQGAVATLNTLSYSPSVNTSFLFINRYYDKRYRALFGNAFGENTRVENEQGIYIGMESNILSGMNLMCYADFFRFPYRRYRVDRSGTMGGEGLFQISYSPANSLSLLIKYTYKNKAQNFTSPEGKKWVLPYIRQRLQYRQLYSPFQQLSLKTVLEYVHASHWQQNRSQGWVLNNVLKTSFPHFPLQSAASITVFHTDDYDARVYMHEPGLLYAFSMQSFYGKGMRLALNLRYAWKERVVLQGKWGWTHYADRDRISSGPEEIRGSDKADLQFQVRLKW